MATWNVINHTDLGSANATLVHWTSIPASYDHLYIMMSQRMTGSGSYSDSFKMEINGETGNTNYSYNGLYTTSGTPAGEGVALGSQATAIGYPRSPAASSLADTFGVTTIWIPNYSNTTHGKTTLVSNCNPNNVSTAGNWYVYLYAGFWDNTDAIYELKILGSSTNFAQHSSVTLYGINGAA